MINLRKNYLKTLWIYKVFFFLMFTFIYLILGSVIHQGWLRLPNSKFLFKFYFRIIICQSFITSVIFSLLLYCILEYFWNHAHFAVKVRCYCNLNNQIKLSTTKLLTIVIVLRIFRSHWNIILEPQSSKYFHFFFINKT